MECDQIVAGQVRDGAGRAGAGQGVGRLAEHRAGGGQVGHRPRLRQGDPQAVERLGFFAVQLLGGIGRVADHVGHQGHGLREDIGRRGGEDIGEVHAGACADVRAQSFDLGGDLGSGAALSPLGQQRGCEIGHPRLARRVVGRAGVEAQPGRDQRQTRLAGHQHPHAVGQTALGHLRRGGVDSGARLRQGRTLAFGQQGHRLARGRQGRQGDRRGEHLLHRRSRIFGVSLQIAHGDGAIVTQVLARHPLHVRDGHGLDVGDVAIGAGRIAGHDQGVAQREGPTVDGLEPPQCAGHQFGLGLGQFGLGDRLVANAGDLGAQGGHALVRRMAGAHHGRGVQHTDLLLLAVGRRGRGRDLLAIDQRLVQPARLSGRQNAIQHVQRRPVGVVIGDGRPGDLHHRQGDVGTIEGRLPRHTEALGHIVDGQGAVGVLDAAEIAVDPGVQLGLVEIPGHDQIGVVGPVEGLMEAQDVVDGGGVQIGDRADARAAIGAVLIDEGLGVQALEPAVGRRQDALAELLLDHVALALERGLVNDQRTHPLGFGEQHPLQMLGRHGLIVVGDVQAGGGVVRAADVLGQPVERLLRQVPRRLEHQVFEHMGEAGAAFRIVLGPDLVPDLDRDVGRGRVARREDPQAIRQRPLGEAQRRHHDGPRRGVCSSDGDFPVGDGGVHHAIVPGRGGAGRDTQHQGGDRGGGEQAGLHGHGSGRPAHAGARTLSGPKPGAPYRVVMKPRLSPV